VSAGSLVLSDGSLRAVLECPTLAFSIKGEVEQRAVADAWAALLNSLDHPVQVVVMTRGATGTGPQDAGAGAGAALDRLRESQRLLLAGLAADRRLVDRRFLMVVPSDANRRRGMPFRLPGAGAPQSGGAGSPELLDRRVAWISEVMQRMDVRPARLSDRQITDLLYRTLNPDTAGIQPLAEDEDLSDWRGVVAPAALSESPTEVRLGSRLARTHAVTAYPQLLRPAWFERLLGLEGDADLSLHLSPIPSEAMMSFLNRRVAELASTLRLLDEGGRQPDPYRAAALSDAQDLQDRLARGDEKLFAVALYATLWADSRQELDAASARLDALLGSMLIRSRRLILQMAPALISTLPLGLDRVGLTRYLPTGVLSASVPFAGNDLRQSGGLLYGVHQQARSAVLLDRFGLVNHNSVVFGTSGGGKSYLVKVELIRAWTAGIGSVVIDPEGEYAGVFSALGGRVVSMRPGAASGLDPFSLAADDPGALSTKVASLLTLLGLLAGGLTANQRAAAEEALSFAYAARGFSDEQPNPGLEPPGLGEVTRALTRRMERWGGPIRGEVEELALRLERYVDGSGRWLFQAAGEQGADAGLIAYVLTGLPEEDRAPAMFVVLDHVWSRLQSGQGKRLVTIDEAWRLMKHPDTAGYVQQFAKTVRKRGAGLTIITQDVPDVLASPIGEAVVTNAATQILMRQAPQAVDRLTELFRLSEPEQSWLLGAQAGEGLLLAEGRRVPFRCVASDEEDRIIRAAGGPAEGDAQ
jgi:hypothetical protein